MKVWFKQFIADLSLLFSRVWQGMRLAFRRFVRNGGVRGALLRLKRGLRAGEPGAWITVTAFVLAVAGVVVLCVSSGDKAAPAVMALGENGDGVIELAKVTPAPTPKPAPTPMHFERDYEGSEVSLIQMRLMELSYMDYDEPTELYGPNTENAVQLFERTNGLPVDGVLSADDYLALMSGAAVAYQVELGVSGTDIKEIQQRLIDLGYMEEGNITGYFGEKTEEAVKAFQSRNNLGVDGMVGSDTFEGLYSEEAVAQALSYGEKSDTVKKIQQRLFKLGYLTTEPDGNFGRDTVSAVRLFQTKNGLIADGYVGPTTKAELFSSSAQPNALTIGDSGDSVSRVQQTLVKLGFLKKTTGYYGSDTEYAVRAFQKRNGLAGDGKAGKNTLSLLAKGADNLHGPSSSYKLPGTSASSGGGSTPSNNNSGTTDANTGYATGTSGSLESCLSIALSKAGCKYVTGAKGPKTFDCSGFVYWCLNQAGVKQSYLTSKGWRSASKYEKITSMSSVKRGDVLVFRMSSSKGHVALALDGSNMVHAGSTKGCVYSSSFKTDYWQKYFYCAYRVF